MLPEEPVSVTAPVALEKAHELCQEDNSEHGTCAWYHGAWQYFRLLGVVASPLRHGEFFRNALSSLAQTHEHSNVLITGTADYSIYAHLLNAYGIAGVTPRVKIIDRCETPLFLCRWYADYVSAKVQTERADILDFAPTETFDVVCTHSFMSRFPPHQRPDLIAAWHNALRPGGKVVTNTRLDQSNEPTPDGTGFTPDQVIAFEKRVSEAAKKYPQALDLEPEELTRMARRFAKLSHNYPMKTERQISDLYEGGGFEIEKLDKVEVGDDGGGEISGPGTARPATYAEIIARRL